MKIIKTHTHHIYRYALVDLGKSKNKQTKKKRNNNITQNLQDVYMQLKNMKSY